MGCLLSIAKDCRRLLASDDKPETRFRIRLCHLLLRCTLLYKNMSVCVIDIVENAKLPLKPTNSHLKLNDIQKPINEWLQLINTRRALGEHHFLLFVDSELILFCRLKYPPTGTVKEMTNQNFLYGVNEVLEPNTILRDMCCLRHSILGIRQRKTDTKVKMRVCVRANRISIFFYSISLFDVNVAILSIRLAVKRSGARPQPRHTKCVERVLVASSIEALHRTRWRTRRLY